MNEPPKQTGLKLAKLPDRKPVKIMIMLPPPVAEKLQAYARAYSEAYGEIEDAPALIPFIIEAFIDSDRRALRRSGRGRSDKVSGDSD